MGCIAVTGTAPWTPICALVMHPKLHAARPVLTAADSAHAAFTNHTPGSSVLPASVQLFFAHRFQQTSCSRLLLHMLLQMFVSPQLSQRPSLFMESLHT